MTVSLRTATMLQTSSTARASTVAIAAPTMPSFGAPRSPKIRMALATMLRITANELIRDAVPARPVVFRVVR